MGFFSSIAKLILTSPVEVRNFLAGMIRLISGKEINIPVDRKAMLLELQTRALNLNIRDQDEMRELLVDIIRAFAPELLGEE